MQTGIKSSKTYKQGEIVDVVFPYEESGESKRRPALVLLDTGDSLILAKITSRHKGRKWDLLIKRDGFNGLSVDSAVQIDKIHKIPKKNICNIIAKGNINQLQLALIKEKIKEYKSSIRST